MKPIAPVSRRRFLKTAAACAASVSLVRPLNAAAQKPSVIVGAHPWVYAATLPKCDITPVLPANLCRHELRRHGRHRVDAHRAAAGRCGCTDRRTVAEAPSAGSSACRSAERCGIGPSIRKCSTTRRASSRGLPGSAAAPWVRRSAPRRGTRRSAKRRRQFDAQAELLRKLIALCQEHGIVLNLHNHTYEVVNGLYDLKGTLAEFPT